MKILKLLLSAFVLLIAGNSFAQSVNVIADPAINELVEKHKDANARGRGFPGYRIQIFSDSGNGAKSRANDKRSEFVSKYPEVPAYLDFNSPNFVVRVGDFRTKLEARKFLNDVAVDFPYAFVRKDMIQPPPID